MVRGRVLTGQGASVRRHGGCTQDGRQRARPPQTCVCRGGPGLGPRREAGTRRGTCAAAAGAPDAPPCRPAAHAALSGLRAGGWIDGGTSAVSVHFVLYNCPTRLLSSVALHAELLPGGGLALAPLVESVAAFHSDSGLWHRLALPEVGPLAPCRPGLTGLPCSAGHSGRPDSGLVYIDLSPCPAAPQEADGCPEGVFTPELQLGVPGSSPPPQDGLPGTPCPTPGSVNGHGRGRA